MCKRFIRQPNAYKLVESGSLQGSHALRSTLFAFTSLVVPHVVISRAVIVVCSIDGLRPEPMIHLSGRVDNNFGLIQLVRARTCTVLLKAVPSPTPLPSHFYPAFNTESSYVLFVDNLKYVSFVSVRSFDALFSFLLDQCNMMHIHQSFFK